MNMTRILIEKEQKYEFLENNNTVVEMVGWHHQLDGHESEQAPGDGKGQRNLACCNPWGHIKSNTTE